jgi:hypothetical protein
MVVIGALQFNAARAIERESQGAVLNGGGSSFFLAAACPDRTLPCVAAPAEKSRACSGAKRGLWSQAVVFMRPNWVRAFTPVVQADLFDDLPVLQTRSTCECSLLGQWEVMEQG